MMGLQDGSDITVPAEAKVICDKKSMGMGLNGIIFFRYETKVIQVIDETIEKHTRAILSLMYYSIASADVL